ncbi:hypothetical protein [Leeuwenhoekiella marinoflava]|uniref:Uncharacterized protein n=2 Tax=Leeuwenhoekiella marinoflava TaxID=988 RepID=A0A4V1KSI5_9FLAO|nr:hypothetical protein [Leeuwenhoekiella marinoflava]RXG31858.1 hypothetical protein DSL99_1682 [Leeuwenhoekiella marinoflava]SHF02463.1 hypothetical protein SAMN02745246_01500 [Leeuwenhoekiella marinoflava DSM 3653]
MNRKELFQPHNMNLLCPHSFEYLHELLGMLGYSSKQYHLQEAREKVFDTLEILFDLEILNIYDWVKKPDLNNKKIPVKKILQEIDTLWDINSEFDHFYDFLIFGNENWYVEQLIKLGLTHTTNWLLFVKYEIGDLENWIEENRPRIR